jgi:hypothetical protein
VGAVSPITVLAEATAERVDEPVGLLVLIAVLLGVLGLLMAALTVLYVRATKPHQVVGSSAQGTPRDGSDPSGRPPAPVSEAGSSAPPPPRRRSPVFRSRTSLWRR